MTSSPIVVTQIFSLLNNHNTFSARAQHNTHLLSCKIFLIHSSLLFVYLFQHHWNEQSKRHLRYGKICHERQHYDRIDHARPKLSLGLINIWLSLVVTNGFIQQTTIMHSNVVAICKPPLTTNLT